MGMIGQMPKKCVYRDVRYYCIQSINYTLEWLAYLNQLWMNMKPLNIIA